jgi:hypothetical protein
MGCGFSSRGSEAVTSPGNGTTYGCPTWGLASDFFVWAEPQADVGGVQSSLQRRIVCNEHGEARNRVIKNHGQRFALRLLNALAAHGPVTLMCPSQREVTDPKSRSAPPCSILAPLPIACNYKKSYIGNDTEMKLRMGRSQEPEEPRQAWPQLRGRRAGLFRALRHVRR